MSEGTSSGRLQTSTMEHFANKITIVNLKPLSILTKGSSYTLESIQNTTWRCP